MLIKPTLEELLERTENRYTLAIVVAKRARQLIDGGQPLVDRESVGSNNIVSVAAEEIAEDKVAAIPGNHEAFVPLRRDVREKILEKERQAEAEMLGIDEVSPTKPALTDQEIEDIRDRGRANVIQHLDPEEADFDVPDPEEDLTGTEPASPLAYDLLNAVEKIGGYDTVEEENIDLLDDLDLDTVDNQPDEDDVDFVDFDDDDDDFEDLDIDEDELDDEDEDEEDDEDAEDDED